jgi:hypothetical protein
MNPIARKGEHTASTASTIARCKEYTIFLEPPTNKKKTFLCAHRASRLTGLITDAVSFDDAAFEGCD